MNFFPFDFKKLLLAVVIAALPLLSLTLQMEDDGDPIMLRPFSALNGAIQLVYTGFSRGVKETTGMYLNLIDIKKENRELKKKMQDMQARQAVMGDLALENQRLGELLDFREKHKMELIAAKIIGREIFEGHYTLLMNRGRKHGLDDGMAVISTAGAVGYVFRANNLTSRILLLTDRYAVIDALVQRTRARGIVEGESKTTCRLQYLEKLEDANKGDLIVTSGLDNIFPKGFPIARVISIEKASYNINPQVRLRPIIEPGRLEEVFVITNAMNEDFSPAVDSEDEQQEKDDKKTEKKTQASLQAQKAGVL